MAKASKSASVAKTGTVKLSSKDFTVNPQTGKVLVSQDKLATLVQSNLNKIKGTADTKAVKISVGVDF
jgi:hypothetical protein